MQVVAFAAWALATSACLALARAVRRRRVARAIVVGGLGIAVAGLAIAAAFATQTVAGELPEGVTRTTAGRLHDFGTLLILAGLVVAAAASVRLLSPGRYRLTVLALGIALFAIVPVLVALGIDAPGVGQRLFILVGIAWQWTFAGATSRWRGPPAG